MASLPQHNKIPHKPNPFPLNEMMVMLPSCCTEVQWLGLGGGEEGEQVLLDLIVYLIPVSEQGLCPGVLPTPLREQPCSPWCQLGDLSMGEAANITGTQRNPAGPSPASRKAALCAVMYHTQRLNANV